MAGAGDILLICGIRLDHRRLTFMVVAALVGITVGLLLPSALADAVDAAVARQISWARTLWLLVLGVSAIGAELVTALLAVTLTSATTAWLRRRLATHLVGLGTRSGFVAGDAVSRLVGDCALAGAAAPLVVQLGGSVLISTGAVVLLATLDLRLAAVFLVSVPFVLLLGRLQLRRTADDALRYQQVSGEVGARLLDAVAGLRTITSAGLADAEAARVLRPLPALGEAGRGIWRTQAAMVWRAGLLYPAAELAVLATAGLGLAAGRLTVGDVLAALGYATLGMALVNQVPMLTTLSRLRGSAFRVAEVLETPLAVPGQQPLPPGPGELRLRGVRVAEVLEDINLTVPGGTMVAVVGRSGSGKSVLAGVLGGLITPSAGDTTLDGVPLGALRPAELRAAVAYGFEYPALLGATVADAVGYGAPTSPEEIRAACEAARVHDLLVRLPDGYRTPLSSTPLSGGEAQRVGLARALVRGPRVLILDDATASLDMVTEAEVCSAVPPGTTCVLVTHRAATAARAEQVIWLDAGQVRAVAPHHDLCAEPDYRRLLTEAAP